MIKPTSIMKKWLSQNKMLLGGMAFGIISGLLYWKFVGCANGTCLIKSNPYYMALYGGAMGWLVVNVFKK